VGEPAVAMSYAEYLALERASASAIAHESVSGVAYAMAGGSIEHGRLAVRVGRFLTSRPSHGRTRDRTLVRRGRRGVRSAMNAQRDPVTSIQ